MPNIIRFDPRHGGAVLRLILDIQQNEFGIAIAAEDQPDLLDIPGFYQSGSGDFWLALDQDRVVGTIALKDIGGGYAALRKMFVASSARGAGGAASLLLETLLAHAARSGIAAIWLGTTDRFVAAHRFYEKHGFHRVDPQELPATFPRMQVDSIFYRFDL